MKYFAETTMSVLVSEVTAIHIRFAIIAIAMIGELYMPHYYLGYQQFVINSEPGSVDSTIDNPSS